MRSGRTCLLVLVALFASAAPAMAHDDEPLVIGHRGAPGYLPDHTLQGYALAIKMGADYIEPDLVATKDGHLIARHEPNITATTDVASRPEFASRRRPRSSTGSTRRASSPPTSRWPRSRPCAPCSRSPLERPTQFDGKFKIPTFDEVIDLAKRHHVGIYPETKHPTYHKDLGLPLEGRLVAALKREGLNRRGAPGLHPVLRAVQPQAAQPHDRRPARSARRRQRRQPRRLARLHGAVRPAVRLDRLRRPAAARAHLRVLRDRRGPARDQHLRRRHRPVEALHRQHDRGRHQRRRHARRRERRRQRRRGGPQAAPADLADPPRPPQGPGHPHVDVPQRGSPASPPTTAATR